MAENVTKMKIISYSDAERTNTDKEMNVQVNPSGYTSRINVGYSQTQAPGTTAILPQFSKIEPQRISFELLFDSTGVINGVKDESNGVEGLLDEFRKVILEYKGDTHSPRFLSIFWGTLKFDCVLESLDISYKLFRSDGLPLRAVAHATFLGAIDDSKRVAKENASSPDLTHVRTVQDGDTLPLMTYRIYGDSRYYIEVAKANGLTDFRNLSTGQKIIFPPIEK